MLLPHNISLESLRSFREYSYKNTEEFRAAITELVENRKTDLTIRYLGDNYNEIDIHRIINEVNSVSGYVISRYVYSVNEAMGVLYLEAIEYND